LSDNGLERPGPPNSSTTDCGFTEAACLEGLAGDRNLLTEIAAAFLEYGPTTMAAAADALARGDADALAWSAHTLKGSLANFRADPPIESALALERCARDGDLAAAAEALRALQRQVDLLLEALAPFAARSGRD